MTCHHCKQDYGQIDGYTVTHLGVTWNFCGRLCLTEWAAPEIKKALVPRQWIPTPEEERRMYE